METFEQAKNEFLKGLDSFGKHQYLLAEEHFSKALTFYPKRISILANLALVKQNLGKLEESKQLWRQILDQDSKYTEAYISLALIEKEQSNFQVSLSLIDSALKIQSENIELLRLKASILMSFNELSMAIDLYQDVLKVEPNNSNNFYNLGLAYHEKKDFPETIKLYKNAINLNPQFLEALYCLGNAYKDQNNFDLAIKEYEKVIEISPRFLPAINNLGLSFLSTLRYEEALVNFQKALDIDPKNLYVLNNLGIVNHELGRFDKAIDFYEKAIALSPSFAEAIWSRSLTHLLLRDFRSGWNGYEWRNIAKEIKVDGGIREFDKPKLTHQSSVTNKTLLLHSEQGLGDTIQFVRYAKQLVAKGSKVILLVQEPLKEILKTLDATLLVLADHDDIPYFDMHCPLGSLPQIFSSDFESIPKYDHYLSADLMLKYKWDQILGPKSKLRVGLVWSSTSAFKYDAKRSINFKQLLKYLPLNDKRFEFISLQKEIKDSDKFDFEQCSQIKFYGNKLDSFNETAALASNMDLVISTCTSVPHLTGALGIPTWLMLSKVPDWRWFLDMEQSPWYPSLKLYRQESIGNWDQVLKEISTDLLNHQHLSKPI